MISPGRAGGRHILHAVAGFATVIALQLLTGCGKPESTAAPGGSGAGVGRRLMIALMPKSKGNAYFVSCKQGAEAAARELGVDLIFDGPVNPDPAKQNEII